jgi:hypothetical protein
LPAVSNPAEFASTNFSAEKGQDYEQQIQFLKGTTTLAFKVTSLVQLHRALLQYDTYDYMCIYIYLQ